MQTTETTAHRTTLTDIRQPVADDLRAVNRLISAELFSEVPLIQEITQYIIESGGKRTRPLVVLLSAKALGYQRATEHHELAVIIEFIHTATLLHDDVVDESQLRRGRQTANATWDNPSSVLVGDFLYSRAFQILARRNNIPVMKVLANTTNQLAEGEVLQLMNRHNTDTSESNYREVIRRKTAQLFSAAAEIGALIATDDTTLHQLMADVGLHLGMAYQIIDDLLDYTANAEDMGKNLGDDLAQGKATLPLIYAMHHAPPEQATLIRNAIQRGSLDNFSEVLSAINSTQAREYTLNCAKKHAEIATKLLHQLPDSQYRQALNELLTFVVARNF